MEETEETSAERDAYIHQFALEIAERTTQLDSQLIMQLERPEIVKAFAICGLPLKVANLLADQLCLGGMALAQAQMKEAGDE